MSTDQDQLELPKAQVKRAVAAHLSAVVGSDGKSAPFHVNKEATLAFSGGRGHQASREEAAGVEADPSQAYYLLEGL